MVYFRLSRVRRRLSMLMLMISFFLLCVQIWCSHDDYRVIHSTSYLDMERVFLSMQQQSGQACIHPVVALHHPDIDRLFGDPIPLQCLKKNGDWVYSENGRFMISTDAIALHGGMIRCDYIPIGRGKDDYADVIHGDQIEQFESGRQLTSDFFTVSCTANDGATYVNTHAGIAPVNAGQLQEANSIHLRDLDLDIIIFGIDSLSRMCWQRLMPKSLNYFVDRLGGTVLEGYNIVGDGTTDALLAILTGKSETELPEARRGYPGSSSVDEFPWIWRQLKEAGYVTQYAEDHLEYSAFNFRLLGFNHQPVDHYMRPFHQAVLRDWKSKYCMKGSMPGHVVMMNWQREFVQVYKHRRKFSIAFLSELTHDSPNQARLADDDLLQLLTDYHSEDHLNNSLLVLMSDHGPRSGMFRATEQGRLEERNPFLGIRFPPWVLRKHPRIADNLAKNVHRLTTPYDVHATMLDVLQFSGDGVGDRTSRGISLLKEIPRERTCSDAGVLPHWCLCMNWQSVAVDGDNVRKAAFAVVDLINNMTSSHRELCDTLNVSRIQTAVRFSPGDAMLKFSCSSDMDGRVPVFSDAQSSVEVLYQLTVVTSPNGGIYEVTVSHLVEVDVFQVARNEISRVDKYGSQPHCIAAQHPHLRQFCYCRPLAVNS